MSTGAILDARQCWLGYAMSPVPNTSMPPSTVVCSVRSTPPKRRRNLQHGADGPRAVTQLLGLGLILSPFTDVDAQAAAALWSHTREHGLSLGDRSCLAIAQRLDRPVLTADQAWKVLDMDLDIQLIR